MVQCREKAAFIASKNEKPQHFRAGSPAIPSERGDGALKIRQLPVVLKPHHWIYFARHARKWSCLSASLGATKLRCHTTNTPGKASLAPVGRERCTSQRARPLDTSNAAACSRKPMVQDATGGGCVTHHRCCCTRAATSCPFKVAADCRRWISRWTKRTRMDPGVPSAGAY